MNSSPCPYCGTLNNAHSKQCVSLTVSQESARISAMDSAGATSQREIKISNDYGNRLPTKEVITSLRNAELTIRDMDIEMQHLRAELQNVRDKYNEMCLRERLPKR